ncbi:MAG: ABC transporter permease [Leptolyngbyaceae cyanobacterium SL_7_1]|nr:ABC transporter permease [Leptolyngbyaceae cyanobacterium SL_7_1]
MFHLFVAEFKRSWIQLLRYPTEVISAIVVTTIVFYGLFLSARYVAGPGVQFGDRMESIIIGYALWSLAMFIMADITGGLQREAQTGTLEQIFISPFGAPKVFLVRALAGLTIQVALNLVILVILMVLTGTRLAFPPMLLLPFVSILMGVYGLAFILGSIALRVKQVQQLLGICQFVFLFLLTVPVESWAGSFKFFAMLLPMVPGAGLLRDLMARDQTLNVGLWAIALVNGFVYLALGLLLFRYAERETKRQGKLAGY